MKKIIVALFVIAIIITGFLIAENNNPIPKGWFPAGSNPSEYEMGIDNSVFEQVNLHGPTKPNNNACFYH